MADFAANVLTPVITDALKWVGVTIIRQFKYLCCFSTNIATLKDKAQRLDDATKGLQGRVDREIDNVLVIVPEVESWLKRSNHIKDEMNGILNQVPNVESGCLKLSARFSLSKRAKKTADRMEELRGQCKFDAISLPGPPPATQIVPLGTTFEFESRKQIEEDIMNSLRGVEVNVIGICGMGGLGKTTMAKIIMNRALEKHLLEEVVMAIVSQPVDKLKIQEDIGRSLGLELEGETSMANRAQKLHARLTAGTKRILLVLDDVWERLELEELGLPRGCKDCKILLTSRNDDVLRAMNVEKVFGMKVLTKEDAWFLFREIVGTCVDDNGLHSIAEQVVEECEGLPIALTTVGAALKDEKNVSIWNDALRQLRKCDPDIPQLIAKVYNPLKLSYNALGSKHAKSVFLLCCLFGEDANIPLEYLTYFCVGLGIFEGNMEEARNRMWALSKMLKSRSLMLDCDEEYCVRMHDVVRDVCIFIAKEEGYIGRNDCTWFSSLQTMVRERTQLPTKLCLLYLTCNSKMEEEIKFDNSFLERIRDLQVLTIENYSSTSLPYTTESLKNLNTLVLDLCWRLETISVVGKLVNLEILICRHCGSIKEFPLEIKGLNRLKLLDLTGCENLERIGGGIISSLVGLEELKMLGSFNKWEAWDSKERENGNARLRELEALTNLRCLEIEIDNHALAAENMRLSSKLERYDIKIHPVTVHSCVRKYSFYYSSKKKMSLMLEGESCLGDWIEKKLLRDAEYLHLTGNGADNVDYLEKCQNIRQLELRRCETMKNIGRTSMDDATVFPHMEFLKLRFLPQLEEILDGPISPNSFHNLKDLQLQDLPALKQLWKSSSSPVLPKLKEIKLCELPNLATFEFPLHAISSIEISYCEMMEQVFMWNDNEEEERRITKVMFPKLKEVGLHNLPNLVTLHDGIGGIEFPLLNRMKITKCPKMKSMVSSEENNCGGSRNADIDDNNSLRLFCQQEKVSFERLKILIIDEINAFYRQKIPVSFFNGLEWLTICEYKGSTSLFTSSIARNFVSLRDLRIRNCDEIVQVIKDEQEKEGVIGGERTLLFPKLESIELTDLCKLVSFCEGNCHVNCRTLMINNCSNMKIFNLGSNVSFSFNGLEELTIFNCKGSMSLFSSSMARNLVNLIALGICNCDQMVKVIEDEKEEENVVSISGGTQTTTTILFPKLQDLRLGNLQRLESFCEWNCDVKLPSLSQMNIWGCYNMKNFTSGHVNTPNLISVEINFKDFGDEKDLNGVLKQQYLEKQKEKAAYQEKQSDPNNVMRKTTTEEEEEGTNGEIEEGQNRKAITPAEGRKGQIEEEQTS